MDGQRSLLSRAIVAGLCITALFAACGDSGGEQASASRPNVVLIVVDDLEDGGAPYWEAMPNTRALIADRGVQFTNSFATDPACCPARASMLSGQYPHNTRVFNAADVTASPGENPYLEPGSAIRIFARGAEKRTIGVRLGEAGYRTAFLGKYLNGYERVADYVPPGWDEWFGLAGTYLDGYTYSANHNGRSVKFGRSERDYQTDVLAEQSVRFVEGAEADDSDPFLLTIWPSAPHAPLEPAPRHRGHRFARAELPTNPNFNEEDVTDKPSWLREGVAVLDAREIEQQTAQYRNALGSLIAVDEMVAELVRVLQEREEYDDTVFIFTSDNGYNRGSHRLDDKLVPYEESIRVPLVIAGPGIENGVDEHLVTHVDLAPTLFDLAGMNLPSDLDGRSLVPLLEGEEPEWRSEFLVEFRGKYSTFVQVHTAEDVQGLIDRGAGVEYVPTYRALRGEGYLYVEWYAGDMHEYELYDLTEDPHQLTNLVATPESAAEHVPPPAELQERLEELAACAGDTCD